ncbi:glutamate-rich protein 1 [Colossoma macropomum]|uniref:glutamate-rich protein 1 n=1 Tax=Colossoma macropomum TaxID=42526 RepID=UPI001863EB58|nr:glutamate-rich protein 1 [Colossoma macropomum]
MSLRKDVFQAKVLQRLYPAAPKAKEMLDSAVHRPKPASAPRRVKVKPNKETGSAGVSDLVGKKVYTVLPPPEDYRLTGGDENPEPISAADGTAVNLSGSEDSDVTEDEGHVRKRRRRRRKRKADDAGAGRIFTPPQEGAQRQAEEAEGENGQKLEVLEGQKEQISKSKKRKLKKKRQKEKLRSLGLAPQSRPLEFTYRQNKGEEEEEENDEENSQKVEEILDFLRTTWDIYLSDRSCTAGRPSLSLSTAESLFTCLSEGTAPPAAVSGLCTLRALLGQRDVERLNTALQEFSHTSTLTTDETVLVCTLFQYWVTEVLPMQTEKKT